MSARRAISRAAVVVATGALLVTGAASGAWAGPPRGEPSRIGTDGTMTAGTTYVPPVPSDLSTLTWTEAFDHLHAKFSSEYAFTEWKGIDWDALYRRYRPLVAAAEAAGDQAAYYLALRGYAYHLRDGHVSVTEDLDVARQLAGGGFGMVATRLDDDSVAVTWVKPGGPADQAGITVGSRILRWDGQPVRSALEQTSTLLGPNQPTTVRRDDERLRYLVRAPIGQARTVTFRTPGSPARTVTLTAIDDDFETLTLTDARSIIGQGQMPTRMVEHEILPGNIGYLRIYAEIDLPAELPGDHTPTLTLFRRAMREFRAEDVAGIVVDLRNNAGGSDQMVADMLASFSSEPSFYEYQAYVVPETGQFQIWLADDETGEFVARNQGITIEPARHVYSGPVVALVNNGCISSCEGLAMGISRLPDGRVVGFRGTNGSFGMAGAGALMPGGYVVKWPYGASLDADRVVQIDSRDGRGGILPDVVIPMTLRNASRALAGRDVELRWGLRVLDRMAGARLAP